MKKYLPPILVIAFGLWWLLWELKILPSFGLLLGTGLIVTGIVFWLTQGINKGTFTPGGFLILLGILRFLRHEHVIRSFTLELPILVIGLGILMLVNRTRIIPEAEPSPAADRKEDPVKN